VAANAIQISMAGPTEEGKINAALTEGVRLSLRQAKQTKKGYFYHSHDGHEQTMPAPGANAMPPPKIAVVTVGGEERGLQFLLAAAFTTDVYDHGLAYEDSL